MRRASAPKSTARSIPYTTPTVLLPPVLARSELATPCAFFLLSVARVPTWNVNAPSTGCESAEMTRQVTTYVPSSSSGSETATSLCVPPGCSGDPVTTRSRSDEKTRMPPSETSTGSLKRSFTWLGGLSYTPPFCGSVVRRVACADAGAAATTTSATTSAPSARSRRIMR